MYADKHVIIQIKPILTNIGNFNRGFEPSRIHTCVIWGKKQKTQRQGISIFERFSKPLADRLDRCEFQRVIQQTPHVSVCCIWYIYPVFQFCLDTDHLFPNNAPVPKSKRKKKKKKFQVKTVSNADRQQPGVEAQKAVEMHHTAGTCWDCSRDENTTVLQ